MPSVWLLIKNERNAAIVVLFLILAIGIALGCGLPGTHKVTGAWVQVSASIGWCYFLSWSVSFYPQMYTNWVRKSVVGLSFDYELLNIVGYICLSVYTVEFYWDTNMQAEYRLRNHGNDNLVQTNDVLFALHGAACTAFILGQVAIYDRGQQRFTPVAIAVACTAAVLSLLYAVLILTLHSDSIFFTWLSYMYFLSGIKMAVTMKYVPQVYMNWKRKSTEGWSTFAVILDLLGGLLSLVQIILDAAIEDDWSGVTGDPVKFVLGLLTLGFDSVFVVQRFVIYPPSADPAHEHKIDSEEVVTLLPNVVVNE